nr:PEP-CTERM sorting domain-containing protein [Halospina denitrificans]
MYEQPVSNESKLFENGFKPVTWDKFDFFLFFDLFSLEAGQDIFHNIDRTHPYEGASVSGPAGDFWLQGRFNKVRTAKVPEPAAIGLLALGLVLFGFLRHRHRTGSAWF